MWDTLVFCAPFAIVGASFLFLAFRPTRRAMLWMLDEDHPIETATALLFVVAAVMAAVLTRKLRRRSVARWVPKFYGVFAILHFLAALEEISWGQRLIGFETPAALRAINGQGETTLHNVGVFQGRSEWTRLGFGVIGLAAIKLRSRPGWSAIQVPSWLGPWFLTIALHATVDACNDIWTIEQRFDYAVDRTSEVIELLMSVVVVLYLFSSARRLSVEA
jgi:hypothetical protein